MIALYSVLLIFLNVVKFLIHRRARTLENKYTRLTQETKKLARPNNRNDQYQCAKQQFELGRLVHLRDRMESKHFAWQLRDEKFGKLVNAVRGWKGRKLPYLCGVVDVTLALYLLNHFGLSAVDLSQLEQVVASLFSNAR